MSGGNVQAEARPVAVTILWQCTADVRSPGVAKMLAGISMVTSRSAAVSRSIGSAVAAGVCLGVLATCTCM